MLQYNRHTAEGRGGSIYYRYWRKRRRFGRPDGLSLFSFFLFRRHKMCDSSYASLASSAAIFIADGEVVFTRYKTDSPLLFCFFPFAGRKKKTNEKEMVPSII